MKVEEPKISHTSTIRSIKIQSITALRTAVTELAATGVKCTLLENATPRGYSPNQVGMGPADFVIKLADSTYDIGLYKTEHGYEARTDWFMGSVEKVLGAPPTCPEASEQAKLGKLFQMYGVAAATEQARRKGLSVRRFNKEDGTICLALTGASL